jgi:hypothetical protein
MGPYRVRSGPACPPVRHSWLARIPVATDEQRSAYDLIWLFVIQSALTSWWSAPLWSSERQR